MDWCWVYLVLKVCRHVTSTQRRDWLKLVGGVICWLKKVTEITSNSVLIFCVLVIRCIKDVNKYHLSLFIRPSSDGTYYGMVMSVRVPVRVSVRPSDSPSVRSPSAHFPHFSPTCFDILSWSFAHDFVLMYYRSSSTVVTLRQFLKELCLFVNLE